MTCTHMFLSRFCKSVTQGLTEKTGLNHGKYLKNHFIDYRKKIRSIQYQFDDSYIQDIINGTSCFKSPSILKTLHFKKSICI